MARGLIKKTKQLNLIPSDQVSATVTGTGVDLGVGADRVLVCGQLGDIVGGTSPTVTYKLQDSADNSTFADVGAAGTALDTADTMDSFERGPVRRYVRSVATITGTPTSVEVAAIGVASGIRESGDVTGI